MTTLAFLDIGFGELLVIGFVALLLFGGKLPEVMRTTGGMYRKLRRGVDDLTRQTHQVFDVRHQAAPRYSPTPTPAPQPPPSPGSVPRSLASDAGPAAHPMATTPASFTSPAALPPLDPHRAESPASFPDDPPPV